MDRRCGGVLQPGGQADRCAGERRRLLAARQRRVHPGLEGWPQQFSSRDEIPAVLVYERPSGITPADQQAVAARSAQFGDLQDVDRDVIGPIPSEDGKALQVLVPINAGSGGWETIGARADDIRRIAADRPDGLTFHVTGPGGFAADSQEAFAGHRRQAAVLRAGRRHRHPAADLPQPGAVAAAGALRRRRALRRAGGHLLPGRPSGPDRQRAERRHPHRPGVRCRDGLCPAAGRPLPRGAAPARGPARGDGVRAAPRRPGDLRQRLDGGRRHALPAVRRDELHRGPRPGRGDRHRGRPARHADPAARAARDLRPLGVLAAASDVRLGGPHRDRRLGAGRPADRPPAARDLGHDLPWSWPSPRSGILDAQRATA